MSKIKNLHEEIFEFLLLNESTYTTDARPLYYTLRVENKGKKLDNGFWFYGDENELLISFWKGNDWLRETPNIYFKITLSGDCSLNFSSGDSSVKGEMFERSFKQELNLSVEGADLWSKLYPKFNYIDTFDYFLRNDKKLIDKLLDNGILEISSDDPRNSIEFIQQDEFEKWQNIVSQHRDKKNMKVVPYALINFSTGGFTPKLNLSIGPLPSNSPFIFITGDNGTGKTSLLKAIAFALGYKFYQEYYSLENPTWQVKCKVLIRGSSHNYRINMDGVMTDEVLPDIPFCCYGAFRLDIEDSLYPVNNQVNEDRLHAFRSLFFTDAIFRDLNRWLIGSLAGSDALASDRYSSIKKLLIKVIPNIYNITESTWDDRRVLLYHELDSEGNRVKGGVTFRKLSSGIRSLIVLLGDMMIRLFEQQQEIRDPSMLAGIVLIDEIDIHLHPKWQRKLPQILHEYFPYVQFIVTTHSPVPLLGAPGNSRLFVVKRESKSGICAERLDAKVPLRNLLPNTILTSPIFGFDDIIPESNKSLKDLRTETNYAEVIKNDKTQEQLQAIARTIIDEKNR
jgi:hypothetical protein